MERQQAHRRRDDRRTGVALAVIGLSLLACALVAVAAAGGPLDGARGGFGELSLSPWLLLVPVGVAVLLGLLASTALRGTRGPGRLPRKPLWLTVLAMVAGVALLSRLDPTTTPSEESPTLEVADPPADEERRSTSWPIWMVVGTGLLAAGALLVRRRPGPEPDEQDDITDQARRAVDDSLAGLAEPSDPREAVILAYARLLDGLAGAGAGRRAADAPFEHARRVLATLGVRPGPVEELTGLFAEARFSTHAITEDDRAAAERALAEVRADLVGVAAP